MTSTSQKRSWQSWKDELSMIDHPEGGYYKETYRSPTVVPTPRGDRPASTAIYYMLPAGAVSRLHRLHSDECWHYYAGEPLVVVELTGPDQPIKLTKVGNTDGCVPQYMVPAGHWFGSYTTATTTKTTEAIDDDNGSAYSLVGCTVAPGFDFQDFEFASRAQLLNDYPLADKQIIERLTEGLP